jgi:hypothetical protein
VAALTARDRSGPPLGFQRLNYLANAEFAFYSEGTFTD